ncbi:hypothetical protein A3H16_04305 [Candidatus Kaiserbacteria bacterium RIFCSPLOWO2_12_FULL_53_8]|uniref:Uncharacterized protein n=2 Tax=Candidatus Kaiseribacteriota TaxID=1752734 RepID=A0A1F6CY33_9BACT|nr:MAG: hypothetical protein A2851_02550 [Candidatus Kaiserbacteria bacterium RIFCSPHIGHO2_01_FULL_53_29]OGG91119.1 MAG: hypothetical protein A3H16_04305 [Candidatus Kaiserbacteria bacterium RIFCSPLOWO2_12_FULL_53_8]
MHIKRPCSSAQADSASIGRTGEVVSTQNAKATAVASPKVQDGRKKTAIATPHSNLRKRSRLRYATAVNKVAITTLNATLHTAHSKKVRSMLGSPFSFCPVHSGCT